MTITMQRRRRMSAESIVNIALFVGVLLLTLSALFMLSNFQAFAAGDRLTDMFQTKSFRGSSEALKNANVLGQALHYIISWFSFLGLCLTLYQKFITLLYLSARNMFDNIYEIKMNKMKGGPMGFKGLFEIFKTGENSNGGGGGFDVFITFVYGLLPNIKAYSDYADDKVRANSKLEETDGPTQYMLKTAIPTIMLVFFLTIGYSGTLGKAYGVVVDGMATMADSLVTKNLSSYVKKMIADGDAYQFTIAARGDASSALADKIAREVYMNILGLTDNADQEFNQVVGMYVEYAVINMMNGGTGVPSSAPVPADAATWNQTLTEMAKKNAADTSAFPATFVESDYKNISYKSFINMNSTAVNPGGEFTFSLDEIVRAAMPNRVRDNPTNSQYVHVLIQYNAKTNANWIQVETNDPNYNNNNQDNTGE